MEKFRELTDSFETEFSSFENLHKGYIKHCEDLNSEQNKFLREIKHFRAYLNMLNSQIKKLEKTQNVHERVELCVMKERFEAKELLLREIEQTLPRRNGFTYKNNYEHFKIVVSAILAFFALILYLSSPVRLLDSLFHFFIVWYYCTLTIRERILIENGSRIKGWWAIYHFILTAEAGVMLIWPRSESYVLFRDQFMLYTFYISFVQYVQYHYQTGCLYKLRALGERHSMDITVDGYMSWMSSRLSFLLIFLLGAYIFQLFNALKLYAIYNMEVCNEWHPAVVGLISVFVAVGNLLTTLHVIRQKFSRLSTAKRDHLRRKYSNDFIGARGPPNDGLLTSEKPIKSN